MTGKDRRLGKNAELRQQVEEMLRKQDVPSSPVGDVHGALEPIETPSPQDRHVTLHELRVHQIQLEMQNEELRRTQAALGAERERYADLYDQAPVGYCTISEQELILEANLCVAGLLDVARDALIKQPITRFILKEDQDTYYLFRKQRFEAGKPQACELRMVPHDGTPFWAQMQATVAVDEGVAPVCHMVMTDISERKRADRELQESKQLIETVVENVPLMIFLKEAQDLRFVVFNKAGEDLLGCDRKDLLGKSILNLFPPKQAAQFMANDRAVLAGGVSLDIPEEPIRTAKRGERLLHTRMICIRGADGVTKYLLGISEDITERKQAEAEREKLEEQFRLSQKMEAIGSLAGGVAHDFNNLLSVILSYTGFAVQGLQAGDPLKNDLLEVKKAGERAAGLTRQLLAFGRKQVLQPVALSLNQSAAGVEKMLRRILGEDIELVQTLAPDLGLTLADPGQIEQVLMNLVVNARDAMPEGGKLTIETSNVEVDEDYTAAHVAMKPGSYVRLAVSDTGCGMDEQTQSRIFEPFFTTKERGKGTGLGLSTVYGIVKQSGGNIWVYSELGQGTTFKVYLPRDLSATAATTLKPSTAPRLSRGTETVLVVEDEEALRKVALRTLGSAGYTVLTAGNGEEALLTSAKHVGDIHLLLTDVVMPRMSGRVLAQQLAAKRPTVKVLYMSGYTDDAIVNHGVLEAGTPFLAKPFTSTDLAQKVREVLDIGVTELADGREAAAKDLAEGREEQPLDKDALQALPPDVLGKLHGAVTAARYDEIVELIETIRLSEPSVATVLRRMADAFDYDGIRKFLR